MQAAGSTAKAHVMNTTLQVGIMNELLVGTRTEDEAKAMMLMRAAQYEHCAPGTEDGVL